MKYNLTLCIVLEAYLYQGSKYVYWGLLMQALEQFIRLKITQNGRKSRIDSPRNFPVNYCFIRKCSWTAAASCHIPMHPQYTAAL